MKKVLAVLMSLVLALPAASLLAQQAPVAPAKQPVQVAQGGPLESFSLFGMGAAASIAVVVVAIVAVAAAVDNNDDPVPVAAAASGTR